MDNLLRIKSVITPVSIVCGVIFFEILKLIDEIMQLSQHIQPKHYHRINIVYYLRNKNIFSFRN